MSGRGFFVGVVVAICLAAMGALSVRSYIIHGCTRYGPQFSHSNWRKVTNGMSATAVRNLIGNPLWNVDYDDGRKLWMYGRDGPKGPCYRRYDLTVSNDVVISKAEFFYWD
jgi:hypothetical protein